MPYGRISLSGLVAADPVCIRHGVEVQLMKVNFHLSISSDQRVICYQRLYCRLLELHVVLKIALDNIEQQLIVNLQAHIFGDPAAQRRAEVAERDTLVQLVNNQAQQLETLRAQLLALRSKSGLVP